MCDVAGHRISHAAKLSAKTIYKVLICGIGGQAQNHRAVRMEEDHAMLRPDSSNTTPVNPMLLLWPLTAVIKQLRSRVKRNGRSGSKRRNPILISSLLSGRHEPVKERIYRGAITSPKQGVNIRIFWHGW
jgi:hypothetical protein